MTTDQRDDAPLDDSHDERKSGSTNQRPARPNDILTNRHDSAWLPLDDGGKMKANHL